MGECTCAEMSLDIAKIVLPDGVVFISVFPGSTCCGDGVAIDIEKLSLKESSFRCTDRDIKDIGDLETDGDSAIIPILNWKEIGVSVDKEKIGEMSEYNTFEDFWHDNQEYAADAVRETLRKHWDKK